MAGGSLGPDFLQLPTGTTAQRPGSPVNGYIRYNTSLNATEVYSGGGWITLGKNWFSEPDILGDGSAVALYRMDGSFNDTTGNYNAEGWRTGGTNPWTLGFNGQALNAGTTSSGGDNIINLPVVQNSYPLSISLWAFCVDWTAKPESTNRVLVNASINGQRLTFCNVDWNDDNNTRIGLMYGGTNHWTFGTTVPNPNEWLHIVWSVVGSNNSGHKVYINGVEQSATNRGGGHGGVAGWNIGGNEQAGEGFTGIIDQVRVFNKALSASEVDSIYTKESQ